MGKFDTHGGYFAPQGYMRVNTGGSHEENPYGGVQIGVDPQGIPNMLEENEVVYDDYVYSDNIKADKALLKKYNIPEKYAGKLYSEIADKFVDEAEDRPNDPISNNGLNAMLVRLAQAQEEQKQIEQQKELEKELANLSPEELAGLEAMLAQQGGTEGEQNLQAPVLEMGQEQMVSPEMMSQPQMMACGGLLRRFDDGTPGIVVPAEIPDTGTISAWVDTRKPVRRWIDATVDSNPTLRHLSEAFYRFGESAPGQVLTMMLPDPNSESGVLGAVSTPVARVPARGISKAQKAKIVDEAMEKAYEASSVAEKTDKAKKEVSAVKKALRNPLYGAGKQTAMALADKSPWVRYPAVGAAQLGQWGAETALLSGLDAGVGAAMKAWGSPWTSAQSQESAEEPEIDFGNWDYASGGPIHRFDGGGWTDFLKALGNYTVSRTPGNVRGKYKIDNAFPLPTDVNSVSDLEQSDAYQAFTDYVLNNSTNENVLNYLKALDAGTPEGTKKLFSGDELSSDWADTYRSRRTDGLGGIYHFSGNSLDDISGILRPKMEKIEAIDPSGLMAQARVNKPDEVLMKKPPTTTTTTTKQGASMSAAPLATWPRYAGAITSGLTGLYNVFQKPDKYNIRRIQPTLPNGRMDLIDPVFNPIDENMAVNDVLANSAGTVRALANSGLGPSTAAAMLAADYNAGHNIGTARTQVWDANNQRRNDVIARRNANAQALGQFNYGIDRDRAQSLNDAQIRNIQNELLQQRLNYDAEGQKYAAISNSLDQVGQALSGIGRENFAMNQVNSTADYAILPNGQVVYRPRNNGNNGGLLKIFKEK